MPLVARVEPDSRLICDAPVPLHAIRTAVETTLPSTFPGKPAPHKWSVEREAEPPANRRHQGTRGSSVFLPMEEEPQCMTIASKSQ